MKIKGVELGLPQPCPQRECSLLNEEELCEQEMEQSYDGRIKLGLREGLGQELMEHSGEKDPRIWVKSVQEGGHSESGQCFVVKR